LCPNQLQPLSDIVTATIRKVRLTVPPLPLLPVPVPARRIIALKAAMSSRQNGALTV